MTTTGDICWHEPYTRCRADHDSALRFDYGRCRSGRRWFWAVRWFDYKSDGERAHGWTDTQDSALTEARAAVARIAAGRPATAYMSHGEATRELKALNAERRKARPASATGDTTVVEYLYGQWWDSEELVHHLVTFRITRKTPKRIYYVRRERGDDVEIGFVDRHALETTGEVHNRGAGGWWAADFHLYAVPPEPAKHASAAPDLAALRTAMADAHPDRGGTSEAFIAARTRYKRALDKAKRSQDSTTSSGGSI